MLKRRIKVLVVDDAFLFREKLVRELSTDPNIEVVGTASDAYMARDKIIELEPDVMTLDVELPRMNGIEFLRRLMPQYPMPVVVVSAISDSVFDALNAGAVDFVAKPDVRMGRSVEAFINELIIKIKIASTAKVGHWKKELSANNNSVVEKLGGDIQNKIIAIGASTGGTEALFSVIKMFPRDVPGTVIVQHMPPLFTKMYADRLNNTCLVEVKEAQTGDKIIPGRVLLAPGDYHMRVKKSGSEYSVECTNGEKVSGHCPSVDVLFDSVAEKVGKNAVGVILTGMGSDGANGLLKMRRKGASTIGQDEESSVVYGMPKVAFDIGAVEMQVSLEKVAQTIYTMLKRK
ncbi:MAG: protein-glutamate methylesterase/protein-glutamine glutaminase [Deltaproteobacteria bacterium]